MNDRREEYHVVEATSRRKLEQEVERLLAQGWRLQGGVCVTPGPGFTPAWWYFQAMTRR